jgi:hypothetical protein
MGATKTRKRAEARAHGYAQVQGIAQVADTWERPRLFDAWGQGVLPGLEEWAVQFRLRCDEPEETYHFVRVGGLTFVVPLSEVRRLTALYPGIDRRQWELWAAREFSRGLEQAFAPGW